MTMIKIRKNRKGFTLIELLLVMAIIGILAGTIMVGMGSSRKKARVTSALKTADSILAEAAECYLKDGPFTAFSTPNGGGLICGVNSGEWPELAKKCSYSSFGAPPAWTFDIACNKTTSNPAGDIIHCDIANASCTKP